MEQEKNKKILFKKVLAGVAYFLTSFVSYNLMLILAASFFCTIIFVADRIVFGSAPSKLLISTFRIALNFIKNNLCAASTTAVAVYFLGFVKHTFNFLEEVNYSALKYRA